MGKKKPLTKTQYQENITKVFSFAAQLIVFAFLVAAIVGN